MVMGSGEGQRTRKASNASVTSLQDIEIFRRATEANSFKICTLSTPPDARSSSACVLRESSAASSDLRRWPVQERSLQPPRLAVSIAWSRSVELLTHNRANDSAASVG